MAKCETVNDSHYFFPFDKVFDTLPPMRYQETMSAIRTWVQQSETKLSIPQLSVTDYEIMEQRLGELQVCEYLNVKAIKHAYQAFTLIEPLNNNRI